MVKALVICRVQFFFEGASTLIGATPITFELVISLFTFNCSICNYYIKLFSLNF
jgi:hypothetical protein